MKIIPAIDIINGQCVRLSQGDYTSVIVYNTNPLEVAKQYESIGIEYLHVVDLDGARSQHIVNWKMLESITNLTKLKVDFGGGMKSNEDLRIAFDCGANQVTAGSIAVSNRSIVKEWIYEFGPDKIALGADVKTEKITINGWKKKTNIDVFDFIQDYLNRGIKEVICTDISKDGMLNGPSFELYKTILEKFPSIKLIASGGVSSMEDLYMLELIGIHGAILGKAIYENKITLKQLEAYVN